MNLRKLGAAAAALGTVLVAATIYAMNTGDPGVSPDNPRFRASVLLLSLYGQKDGVEAYVRENHTLHGVGGRIAISGNTFLGRAVVSDTGSMVVFDAREEFVVSLEPSLVGGQVHWRCSVTPAKWEPKPCRTV
jgi:hypothetical protein